MIATYPVYISVLAGFTHRHTGPIGATDVLAGTLVGLLGTAGFYVVLVVGLAHLHLAGAVLAAIGATLAIQAATMRRAIGTGLEPETIEVPSQV